MSPDNPAEQSLVSDVPVIRVCHPAKIGRFQVGVQSFLVQWAPFQR